MKRDQRFVQRLAFSGLLVAIMLILGYIESLLPLPTPVPGIKLGISNSALLFALYLLGVRYTFVLMLLKVGLSGLLFGSPMTMLFALCGGLLSVLVMVLLSRIKGVDMIVVSMAGAVFHNVGQILAAMAVMSEVAAGALMGYMAVLMAVGMVTGALTGVLGKAVTGRLRNAGFRL